jgi:hypothetical protein
MLGICINWIFQSGISLYLILFFVLGLLPITSITVTTFVWALTKKEFWVKQVYSLDEVRKLEYMLMNGDKNGRDKNFMGK